MLDHNTNPMKISIDKHKLPIPESRQGKGRARKYPLDQLQVGQSFSVQAGNLSTISSCASRYSTATGKKFVVRVVGDNIIRVWRIA